MRTLASHARLGGFGAPGSPAVCKSVGERFKVGPGELGVARAIASALYLKIVGGNDRSAQVRFNIIAIFVLHLFLVELQWCGDRVSSLCHGCFLVATCCAQLTS